MAAADDGGGYYLVHFTEPTNTLIMRNSQLSGHAFDSRARRVDIGMNTMGKTIVQNCAFNFFNGAITGATNTRVLLTGNTSFNSNKPGPKRGSSRHWRHGVRG
jgi:hypothetical protein